MRVAFLVSEFPSLSETFILNQIVDLLRRGHEVDIDAQGPGAHTANAHADIERFQLRRRTRYTRPPSRWLARAHSAAGRIASSGWRHPWTTLDSLNVLRHGRSALSLRLLHERLPLPRARRNHDVVHCHFGPNGRRGVALREAGALRGAVVTSFHGYDVNELPRAQGPRLYADLFERGDVFTVGSEFLRRRVLALGAPEDRVIKLPMGVDVSRFRFRERGRPADGAFRLLTVARLVEVKGIEYALRAIAIIKDKCPGLRYRIAGEGPLRGELEALAKDLGLGHRVEFLGALSQEQVLQAYDVADAFVLPSVVTASGGEENQPVAVAEAQACGLPVVATTVGGIPESVVAGQSALLVPPRDAEALGGSILWLADHPGAWGRMGRAGRSYVEEHFDREMLYDRLMDVYGAAITRHAGVPAGAR